MIELQIRKENKYKMSEMPPYEKGIVATLKWNIDNDKPLEKIPYENNFCNSGYKCYYGGVIPPYTKPDDAVNNFIIAVLSDINQPSKNNKPTVTKINTNSFFVILSDIKNEENVKIHFFFYDGIEAIKNIKKQKYPVKEFFVEDIEKSYRKPWGKINIAKINNMKKDLQQIFEEFSKKVKEKQLENAKHTEHPNNCECGENHDAADCTGNNESGE